jgi:hypothetical protein
VLCYRRTIMANLPTSHPKQSHKQGNNSAPLFGPGHELERLVRPEFSKIRDALSCFDISLMWRTTKYDDSRRPHRICYSELHGPGSELCMPLSGAYLASPGKNAVFFPDSFVNSRSNKAYAGIDRTALKYLAEQGFLGNREGLDYILVSDFDAMQRSLEQRGRKVYSVDDLGSRFDGVSANSQEMMTALNSKEHVSRFTKYAPKEIKKSAELVSAVDFRILHRPGLRVFIKTCNTEAAGEGVFPVATEQEFITVIERLKQEISSHKLNSLIVLQAEISGKNKSFQVLLDPRNPREIPVIALTDQLIQADGKSYAGSINHQITADNLRLVGPAIIDMVDRIRIESATTSGFLMCDYFECANGKVVLFDPGLRPTGNTPAAMVKLWFEERTGEPVTTTSFFVVDFKRPILYSEIVEKLGSLADCNSMLKTKFGVLPWGHNHVSGRSIFTLITPDASQVEDFGQRVRDILRD